MSEPVVHRCHFPDVLASTEDVARWQPHVLSYWQAIRYPGVDPARVARNYARALAAIEAVCDIKFVQASSPEQANIVAVDGPIDGPGNIVALSELPSTDAFNGVLHQTFDDADVLDDDLMVACMTHELGHILGLVHSERGTLMYAILDPSVIKPQALDIARLQAKYGPPKTSPTPASSAEANSDSPGPATVSEAPLVEFEVTIAGHGVLTLALSAKSFVPETPA